MTARHARMAAVRDALGSRGGDWVDLPVLLPAGLVLELAGEDLRPRLIFASGPDGKELCLRPDLTMPAALRHASGSAQDSPAAILCAGTVFRAPRPGEGRPSEFSQLGLERFDDADRVAADVDVASAARAAVLAAGVQAPVLHLADGGLMDLVLKQADLPEPWAETIKAGRGGRRAILRALARAEGSEVREAGALESALAGQDRDAARAVVGEVIALAGLTHGGARGLEAIADRMAARARRAAAPPLAHDMAAALRELVTLEGPARATLDAVTACTARLGADLSVWREDWEARLSGLEAACPDALSGATFEAARPGLFDYYDGFVFDLALPDQALPLASGGRYDGLVAQLSGGKRRALAVGCVVRPDRIEALS